LGFVLGNGTVKGTLGFKADTGYFGNIMSYINGGKLSLDATVSLGLAYTSDIISAGLGYNYTYIDSSLDVHTPVFMINAMNDSLRICIPFQIADAKDNSDYSAFSTTSEIRYYTGVDSINAVRLYINYGKNSYNYNSASSFGLELRFYFLPTTINDVWVNPFIKVLYYSSLDAKGKDVINKNTDTLVNIQSYDRILYTSHNANEVNEVYESNPYILRITPALSLYADSDIVSLYFEPSIGYKIIYDGKKSSKLDHALTWGAYSEVRIYPLKDLEWYFEMGVNSSNNPIPVNFRSATGINWYLPQL
ncbi:variable surface family protein, partial [Brachyspira hampsonii]|uniref:variable surface family protein n=1 Tax=Brachyspira hampsonii TaxID=1287055 RepID=UPI001CA4B745